MTQDAAPPAASAAEIEAELLVSLYLANRRREALWASIDGFATEPSMRLSGDALPGADARRILYLDELGLTPAMALASIRLNALAALRARLREIEGVLKRVYDLPTEQLRARADTLLGLAPAAGEGLQEDQALADAAAKRETLIGGAAA